MLDFFGKPECHPSKTFKKNKIPLSPWKAMELRALPKNNCAMLWWMFGSIVLPTYSESIFKTIFASFSIHSEFCTISCISICYALLYTYVNWMSYLGIRKYLVNSKAWNFTQKMSLYHDFLAASRTNFTYI